MIKTQVNILKELKERAWIEIDGISSDEDLIKLAGKFGEIIPHSNGKLIFNLRPKSKKEGLKRTFSNRYGNEKFPFHTDTAFWAEPARYVLLHSNVESNCATLLLKSSDIFNTFTKEDIKQAKRSNFIS